jgi:hypothetical protein
MTPARRLRNILGGSAGNFVEWFDWFAYSSFAIYFSKAFFPASDQTAQLLGVGSHFWRRLHCATDRRMGVWQVRRPRGPASPPSRCPLH